MIPHGFKYESNVAKISLHQQSNNLMDSFVRTLWHFIWRLTKARSKEALQTFNISRMQMTAQG